ncbi:MAG TPA: hypothetical protein VIF09_23015 [Polyangiaceae bacterium]|jgi:hypothetical protein
MMTRHAIAERALLLAAALSACATSRGPEATPSAPTRVEPGSPEPASFGDLSTLRASLHGPARLDYEPRSLGVAGQFVSIRVENTGAGTVPIPHLHASFAATREDVAFPCNVHVAGAQGAIEPPRLDPGQSFTFERLLDCAMTLPGRYDVRVWMHVDREKENLGDAGVGAFVGSLAIEVMANAGNAPHALPAHPGLYALMTGAPTAPPMTADAWARGDYQVVVALVNGGREPVPVGPARVSLLVFKQGAGLPCAGQEDLQQPASLAPGRAHVVRVPVTCAPTREGHYELVGRLSLGGEAQTEIGRVGLLVTQDATFQFMPAGTTSASQDARPR